MIYICAYSQISRPYTVSKMKQILFCVAVLFAVCSCRKSIGLSDAVPRQQIFVLSPVTLIEMKMPENEQKVSDEDTRCSIYDSECQKNFFQTIAVKYAPTGIPELGIPVLDPYKLSNVSLSILGLLDLTLVEGAADGIGKCVVTKFVTNVDARYREPNIICDTIVIHGRYKLSSAMRAIMGDVCDWCNVHGEGNLKIVLDGWFFKFRYPFRIVRRTDGQIYMDAMFDKAEYQTSVKKVTVDADSIMVGNHDVSKHVVSFINNHWKLIMRSNIGQFINDQSAEYYYDIYKTFFDKSPANTYLKDDLTPLIDK